MKWNHPLEDWTQVIVSFDGKLVKWEIDIIENPKAHFKAEDDRRWGVYNREHQTLTKFLEKPKFDLLPTELYEEIKEYINNNFSKEDFIESNEQYLKLRTSHWVPATDLIYSSSNDGVKKDYYIMDSFLWIIIYDRKDPFDFKFHKEKIDIEEVLSEPDIYPKEVIEAIKK